MPSDNLAYAPHIPDAVRRASARADELAREAGVANMPPLEESEGSGEDATVVTDGREAPPFELTPPEEHTEAPPASQPRDARDDGWERRYNTLQGKYNTEIAELRGQVRSLENLLGTMRAQPQFQPQTEAARPQATTLPPVTIPDEDVQNYGEDLITRSQGWAEARLAPRLAELERRLMSVEGGNQQLASYTTGQRVEMHLDRDVPDWRAINVDPQFIGWLGQQDPFSGHTRKALIEEAYGSGDAARTAAFFHAFQREHTAVTGSPGTQAGQTDHSAARLPLADLAVPGRGASVSSPAPGAPTRRTWTGPEIAAFYRQKNRGAYVGREDEAARIEQDIINASAEGRYRQ
jgi:hypothetical protein